MNVAWFGRLKGKLLRYFVYWLLANTHISLLYGASTMLPFHCFMLMAFVPEIRVPLVVTCIMT